MAAGAARRHRRIHPLDAAADPDLLPVLRAPGVRGRAGRSEEHTSELQSLMRISYAVFCLKKKNIYKTKQHKITVHTYLIYKTNTYRIYKTIYIVRVDEC